jgi:glycosyltransferase involved in cell wall biosynthesis
VTTRSLTTPRLALVTRRFWPLIGPTEVAMGRLAAALHARGARVTVLTAHWQTAWPREFDHLGVRVVRLPPPRGRFGTLSYMATLGRWLRRAHDTFDLVYVSALKHDAYAALRATRERCPVVLRPERAGMAGDCHWQLDARCGARIKRRCSRAAAFVASTAAIERELIAAGYPRDRIQPIPLGVPLPGPSSDSAKQAARASLAQVQPQLQLPADARLALFVGALVEDQGLEDLLDSWSLLSQRQRPAYLWIIGDGPLRARLNEQVATRGLSSHVRLPGEFDDVEEFLAAADLFVRPARQDDISLALVEALAHGLPSVVSDTPSHRSLTDDGRAAHLVPRGDAPALADAIEGLWSDPERAARLGACGRQHAGAQFDLQREADRHLSLFHQLLASTSGWS